MQVVCIAASELLAEIYGFMAQCAITYAALRHSPPVLRWDWLRQSEFLPVLAALQHLVGSNVQPQQVAMTQVTS